VDIESITSRGSPPSTAYAASNQLPRELFGWTDCWLWLRHTKANHAVGEAAYAAVGPAWPSARVLQTKRRVGHSANHHRRRTAQRVAPVLPLSAWWQHHRNLR
jgi:hypothetical protein